eukprot:365969-Chlamydomonas_euryale.AAC.18
MCSSFTPCSRPYKHCTPLLILRCTTARPCGFPAMHAADSRDLASPPTHTNAGHQRTTSQPRAFPKLHAADHKTSAPPTSTQTLATLPINAHRHRCAQVQRCTLLSIKTGGCPETCNYCSQSTSWSKSTGLKAEKLMSVDDVYEVGRCMRACAPAWVWVLFLRVNPDGLVACMGCTHACRSLVHAIPSR